MQNKIFCYILLKNDSYCGITILIMEEIEMAKEKEEKKVTKKKIDKNQLAIKVMAGLLAAIMVVAFAGTLIFYVVAR